MLKADMYLDQIDLYKYLPQTDCGECGVNSCHELLKRLKTGKGSPELCPHFSRNMVHAFNITLNAGRIIPEIEVMQLPVPAEPGLLELNMPDEDSTVLISGNSELTQLALSAVLATTSMRFYVLFIDTRGNTVDMAMIYGVLTEERIKGMLEESNLMKRLDHREMVIPGLAGSLQKEMERLSGWTVHVGPVCCGELPLYFGESWAPPGNIK